MKIKIVLFQIMIVVTFVTVACIIITSVVPFRSKHRKKPKELRLHANQNSEQGEPVPPNPQLLFSPEMLTSYSAIENLASGECLEYKERRPGLTLRMYPCHTLGDIQQFTYENETFVKDTFCISNNARSGEAATMTSCNTTSAVNNKEGWIYQCVKDKQGIILLPAAKLCLEAPTKANLIAGNSNVLVKPCSDSCSQLWRFDAGDACDFGIQKQGSSFWGHDQVNQKRISKSEDSIRILCWVMTDPNNLHSKAVAVNQTWGRDCNTLLFMSSIHHPRLNTVKLWLTEKEQRSMLWHKARMAWMYVYAKYKDEFDWFMRADDDTFVMMDNLRQFLGEYDPQQPHFLGRTLVTDNSSSLFYSGGGTNILSHSALVQLGRHASNSSDEIFANVATFADDVEIARTLKLVGISTEDTRDAEGRERFFPLGIESERTLRRDADPTHWYWEYSYHPAREGLDCCSKWWIASHYTSPDEMYKFEQLHAFGCEAAGRDPVYYA